MTTKTDERVQGLEKSTALDQMRPQEYKMYKKYIVRCLIGMPEGIFGGRR